MKIWSCGNCGYPIITSTAYKRDPEFRWVYRRHAGRNLCTVCHAQIRQAGHLDRWLRTRLIWPRDQLMDEWVWLRDSGASIEQAAEQLGMTWSALDRALHRALRDGDDRGRHNGCARLRKQQVLARQKAAA
jgi:hypothetical protein